MIAKATVSKKRLRNGYRGRHSLAPLKITSRNIFRHSEKYDRKHGVTHAQKIFRENRIELLRIMAQ